MRLDPDTRAILVKYLMNSMVEVSGKLMGGDYSDENLVAFDELTQLVKGVVMIRPEEVESTEEVQPNE
jgi:hypothetical protein